MLLLFHPAICLTIYYVYIESLSMILGMNADKEFNIYIKKVKLKQVIP